MSNKPRVIITIHHRDESSLGANRQNLGLAAYHWGVLIQPKTPKGADSSAYDVSDASIPDNVNRRDLNPGHDWHFRPKHRVNPVMSGRLLGRVMIGKVPPRFTEGAIEALLREVPLPIKNVQNCVTWIVAAIKLMQQRGLAEAFDVNQFMTKSLDLGDKWLRTPNPSNFHNYTNRAS